MNDFIKELEEKNDWELLTIDEVNKYEGLKREVILNYYHAWLWNERRKPAKAKECKEYAKELLSI